MDWKSLVGMNIESIAFLYLYQVRGIIQSYPSHTEVTPSPGQEYCFGSIFRIAIVEPQATLGDEIKAVTMSKGSD